MTTSQPREPIGTGTPDAIEVETVSAVNGVVEQGVAESWGDRDWTQANLSAFGAMGKRTAGTCAAGRKSAKAGCMILLGSINDLDRPPLVLESEWCARDDAIDCDFQKHRVARADHRVMIFQGGDIELQFERMTEHVRGFAHTSHTR
jgi:hypothetical protein